MLMVMWLRPPPMPTSSPQVLGIAILSLGEGVKGQHHAGVVNRRPQRLVVGQVVGPFAHADGNLDRAVAHLSDAFDLRDGFHDVANGNDSDRREAIAVWAEQIDAPVVIRPSDGKLIAFVAGVVKEQVRIRVDNLGRHAIALEVFEATFDVAPTAPVAAKLAFLVVLVDAGFGNVDASGSLTVDNGIPAAVTFLDARNHLAVLLRNPLRKQLGRFLNVGIG